MIQRHGRRKAVLVNMGQQTRSVRLPFAEETGNTLAERIVAASLNGIYIYEFARGRNTFINPQYTVMTGYTKAHLDTMSPADFRALFHPEDFERVCAHLKKAQCLGDREVIEIEYRFRAADGRWLWCYSRDAVFERDVRGAATCIIGTFLDTTTRNFEASAGQNLSASAPNDTDPRRRVRYVREGRELVDAELPLQCAVAENRPVPPVELEVELPSGRCIFLEGSGAPVRDAQGHVTGGIVVTVDVTGCKPAEEARRREVRRFELLARAAALLLRTKDLQSAVSSICRGVIEHLDCDVFFNYLLDEPTGHLRLNAFAGIPDEEACRIEWLDSGRATMCGCAAWDARRAVAEYIQDAVDPRTQLVRSYGVRAYAAHPLLGPEERVLGTLSFGTRRRDTFSDEDLSLMKAVADHVAVAMLRLRHEETLRQNEEHFRTMANSIPQLAWMATPGGDVYWYNQRWYEFTGTTREQAVGWEDVLHPSVRPAVTERWTDSISTGNPFEMEFPLRAAEGCFRRFLVRVLPLKDSGGRVVQWLGTHTDITEFVEAQESLRDADRRKNEFLAVLSHELRNPLTPIRNSLHVLERAVPGGEQATRAHAVIARQVDHMARLVDDLLEVTRITRGTISLQRERVELGELVRRTVEDHRSLFLKRDVELGCSIPDHPVAIEADPTRLAQVIGNLLHNAAKFTPAGGSAHVTVEVCARTALFRVRDSGAGIAASVLPRLFEPFMQADMTLDRSAGGLGLGLALVKGLVELHGGTVSAHSDGIDQGAEFVIQLPRETDERVGTLPRADASVQRALRILIIEDNHDAAESLHDLLSFSGHEVSVAYSGRDGVEKACELEPDVVLCDLGLPGMDGYEVARTLRGHERLRNAYLVVLSGYARPEDVARAKEAGFDRHLAKPAKLEQLEAVLGEGAARARVPIPP